MGSVIMRKRANRLLSRDFLKLSVLGFMLSLGAALPSARATLVIEAPDIIAAPGSSGEFDVLIRNDGPDSFDISSFTLQLTLEGGAGALFNPAPTIATTSREYIFVDSIVAMGLVDFSADAFPTDSFIAADTEFTDPFFRTIGPGDSFGLAHVFFELDPAASGPWTLTIGPGTSLSDPQGNLIDFSVRNGSVTVIPEPASAALLLIGIGSATLLPLPAFIRRHRSRRPDEPSRLMASSSIHL
jgi:hypothetical protein